MRRSALLGRFSCAVVVLLLIVACAPASSPPAASTSGPAASGQPIRIGVVAPFTGGLAFYGERVMLGIQLAMNERGNNVKGRPFEFLKEDEGCTPEGGVNAANKLVGR